MQTDLVSIILQLLVLFFLMAVGYSLKYGQKINTEFDKKLSYVVINVTMPCMILSSVLNATELPSHDQLLFAFGIAVATYAVMIVLAEIAVRLMFIPKGHRGVYRFMSIFGNVGFVGFPVLSAIFGDQAIVYAAIFNIPFNLLVFTLGVMWLMGDGDNKGQKVPINARMFITPCNVACVVIIILCIAGINYLPFFSKASSTLGGMTTPCALIIIGSTLANVPAKELIRGLKPWLLALVRLIAMPLAVWFVFHFFVSDPLILGIIVVVSGMPVATNGTLLCFQYGGDLKAMSQGTFISTLMSFITTPLLAVFLTLVS